MWLPYGRSEIPVRVPDERLIDIFKVENLKPILDTPSEATKLLDSNDSFLQKASSATHPCIVLGSCGSAELATELCSTVLRRMRSQSSATILYTEESTEINPEPLGGSRVLRHTKDSETTVVNWANGRFSPQINSEFVSSDLRILIGELRPHHLLKYSGLCDLVFPCLTSEISKKAHFSDGQGVSVTSLHAERLGIAASFDNTYALGLVLDGDLKPVRFSFDEVARCLETLEPIGDELFSKQISKRSDILVMSAGGAPFDATLARAVDTFPAALQALKKDGALIVSAECQQGHGGAQFYDWSAEHKEPRYLEARLRHHFSYGGFKAAFLSRTLQSHRVHLVSTIPDHYVENVFNMKTASTVNAALQSALRAHGSDSTISIIPNASRVSTKILEAVQQ